MTLVAFSFDRFRSFVSGFGFTYRTNPTVLSHVTSGYYDECRLLITYIIPTNITHSRIVKHIEQYLNAHDIKRIEYGNGRIKLYI